MSALNLIQKLSRLSVQSVKMDVTRNISSNSLLLFRSTPCLLAEPLKKKKRLDPAIVKAREERKKKKIEKQIRRLEKNARQLKPIEECEVPLTLLDEKKSRMRTLPKLTSEILEERALLQKQWATFKREQHLADVQMLDRMIFVQQRALDELKNESEELYNEAIQPDFQLLPFKAEGPVETPPIANYDSPDGDYLDVSKKWE